MIIRRTGTSQLLITQPDHAALAARIMHHWRADGLPETPRRPWILLAVEEHDNGWREVDAAPIADPKTGELLDFINAPDAVKRGIWPRGVERLAPTPYAAALVAQHAIHVYRRHRVSPEWAPFFADMEARRHHHLEAASIALDDLLREYFYVRIADLMSLTFCNGWTGVQTDDMQTDGSAYTIRHENSRLVLAPDPFGGREVPLEIAARELPCHPFRSASEAHHAFVGARKVVLTGAAAGR